VKLQQALDAFLLEDRAQSTNDTYFKTLKKALAFLGPERDVDLVTREDILRYIKHLHNQVIRYENHPSRPPERGGLSPRTVEKHAKNLVTFFRWCEKNNLISKNPTTDLQLRRYHRPPGASKAATTE
jgi:site-specific recombinase XerD